MTYAACGDLGNSAFALRSEAERRNLTHQMAAALVAFHARGLVHDDVKISNFVPTAAGRVLLIDFQSTWAIGELVTVSPLGSLAFESTERIARDAHGQPADAWALGIAFWTFWEAIPSWPNFVALAEHEQRIAFTSVTPPDIRTLVCGLLKADPAARLTARDVATGAAESTDR
jgi:serine/threonine protein kinase